MHNLNYSPVADVSVLNTSIVILVEEGLLEANSICINPSSSLALYADWLKLITNAVKELNSND